MGRDAEVDSRCYRIPRQSNVEPRRNRVKIAVGNKATAVDVSTAIASTHVRKKSV